MVSRQSLTPVRTLPARFEYDDTLHVAVRAATEGVLESITVKPGDVVQRGQTIAVLRSPQIGAARGQVLTRLAALQLRKKEHQRQVSIAEGVEKLVEAIGTGEPIERIETMLEDDKLGQYRSPLMGSYSRSILAGKLANSAASISSGAISGRVVRTRESEQQQAAVALEAEIEQAVFQTQQDKQKTQAAMDTAKRDLIVAEQTLVTLQGITGDTNTNTPKEEFARLKIRSPLAGTVEQKVYSVSERVASGAELFVIADTSWLWVEADIRGRDWNTIEVREGDVVTITTPAVENARWKATVYFVGRQVDPATGAIPLVARVTNEEGRFRPGLFARMEVPIETIEDAVAVPDSALIDLDGQLSVFVAQGDGFQPVAVDVGARAGTLAEILSGLHAGQAVVTTGAFVLKSELLLEGEQ